MQIRNVLVPFTIIAVPAALGAGAAFALAASPITILATSVALAALALSAYVFKRFQDLVEKYNQTAKELFDAHHNLSKEVEQSFKASAQEMQSFGQVVSHLRTSSNTDSSTESPQEKLALQQALKDLMNIRTSVDAVKREIAEHKANLGKLEQDSTTSAAAILDFNASVDDLNKKNKQQGITAVGLKQEITDLSVASENSLVELRSKLNQSDDKIGACVKQVTELRRALDEQIDALEIAKTQIQTLKAKDKARTKKEELYSKATSPKGGLPRKIENSPRGQPLETLYSANTASGLGQESPKSDVRFTPFKSVRSTQSMLLIGGNGRPFKTSSRRPTPTKKPSSTKKKPPFSEKASIDSSIMNETKPIALDLTGIPMDSKQ